MTSKSSSLPRQVASSDSKTNQDVVSSKPGKSSGGGSSNFSRGSRRREPAQGSLSSANPNKPGPRSKTGTNKRPPPRGCQNYYNDKSYKSFAIDNVDEADEFEIGSIFNPGSKKQNYNHLLNFQYDKRGSGIRAGHNNGGARTRGHKKQYGQDTPRVKYDHTHYLQANCQFTVRADQDYSVQLVDPDIMVNWDNIEQVELRTCGDDKEQTSCPICLFPPTAGKMSECGHVYCWSCILHYLALSDDDYRPCPICHKTITKSGLKSVKILSRNNYSTGDKVSMTLMKRERNSMFAVPVTNTTISNIPDIDQQDVDTRYLKMMLASPAQVISNILDRERAELQIQWDEEKHQPESCFVQEAISLLDKRQEETEVRMKMSSSWVSALNDPIPDLKNMAISNSPSDDSGVSDVSSSRHASGVSSDSISSNEDTPDLAHVTDGGVGVGDLDISAVQSEKSSAGKPRQVFYFYQSSDGQPIFLHALNVEMLVKQYGALEKCPPVIESEILEKEGSVMTTELRDRLRYLRHLSVATNFEVAELNLTKLVSDDVIKIFKDQIEARKRKRNRKLRDEKRREKKIQHEESRLMGYPGSMIRVESDYNKSLPITTEDVEVEEYPSMSASEETTASCPSVLSFANITRAKPVATQPSPSQPSSTSSGTTWACLGSVKPLQARRPVVKVDSDNEDEDYVPPPPAASLGDTLAAALQAADTKGQAKGKGKKGGRNKGKTLVLSGAAVRNYN